MPGCRAMALCLALSCGFMARPALAGESESSPVVEPPPAPESAPLPPTVPDPVETEPDSTTDESRSSVPKDEGGQPQSVPEVDQGEPDERTLPPAEEPSEPVDDVDPFGDDTDDDPWLDDGGDDGDDGDDDAVPLPDYDPMRDSPQALQARHWVRAGIVTMSAGGALLLGAVLMGASDPCNLAIGNSCQRSARNRAALVMGLPAAVLIGGGAAALAVGMTRRNALAVDVHAGRGRFGVGVRGRF